MAAGPVAPKVAAALWLGGQALAVGLLTLCPAGHPNPAKAQAPAAASAVPVRVDGAFLERKPGQVSTNLSGIACAGAARDGARTCLVVDDESGFAQVARLAGGVLHAGKPVHLVTGSSPSAEVLGTAPSVQTCPGGSGQFRDLDGEGVAFEPDPAGLGGHFYVAGSHGCSRNKGEFRPAGFLLARVRLNGQGVVEEGPVLTWRLSGALRGSAVVGAYFGRPLDAREGAHGLNVEGIAVSGGRLLAGLRAPSINGMAYVVSVPLADLFALGHGGAAAASTPIMVPLGRDAGIRDMAPLPDGRLLVLSGPAQDQADVPSGLHAVDLSHSPARVTTLETWTESDGAKPEGVAVLAAEGSALRVLVLCDGPANGRPTEHRVTLH